MASPRHLWASTRLNQGSTGTLFAPSWLNRTVATDRRAPACNKRPTLTDIEVLWDKRGAKVDHLRGYLGLRSVSVELVIDPQRSHELPA